MTHQQATSAPTDAIHCVSTTPRILLVENNADADDYVKQILSQRYEVEIADGVAALADVRQTRHDLVLIDVMMPRVDGFDWLQELRADPNTKEIPIILLSARAGEESCVSGLQKGADDYLIKPFSAHELWTRIDANLRLGKLRAVAASREQQLHVEAETARAEIGEILESITDAFVAFDRQWRCTYVNQEAAWLLQREREELLGQQIWFVFPDFVGTRLEREFQRAVAEQVTVDFEQFYQPFNSWVEVSAYPNSKGLAVYFRDITERKQTQEALRQSEERLHVALKNAPVNVFNQDLHLRYTWEYNPNFEYEAEAILGKRDADLLTSDDAEVLTQIKRRVLETGVGTRQEVKLTIEKQDWYYDLTVEPLRDVNNEIIGVTCAAVDIRERKQAEMALRKSETLLNALLTSAPIGIAFLDSDLRYIHANPALAKINGLPVSEHLGRTLWEVLPAWAPRLAPIFQQVMETKEPLLNQHIRGETNPPGVHRHSLVNFYPVCLPDGQMLGVGVTSMEVTELKRVEQALRESELRFRRMADGAPVFIWMSGMDGHCTYFNQPWLEFVGQTLEEALSRSWSEGIHPEDKESCLNAYKTAFSLRHRILIEYRHRRQDGEYRWLLYEGVPLNSDGNFLGYISSGVDITDRKRAEAEREQLLARAQAYLADAEAANRIKDEFLAVLSHELRSPLNPILGWAKLLRSRKFDEKATDRALETIERNAKLQAQLIEDLLDVSRILRGKMVLNVYPVNLVTTIEAALETVRLAAEAKAIQLQTVLDSNVGLVSGDTNRLQQVVWNLVSNAVKFTPIGGRVEVRLERVGSYAEIQVKDTGKGISPEFLPHVFEYFRQENSATTRNFGGLGLGLAIVRYLTELHGGSVKAESSGEGLGATFTVRLPLMEVACEITEGVQTKVEADLSGLRVLIVDDEADMRELVAFILQQSGAEVTITKSASEVLLVLEQSVPDVLLSDIGMPDIDGYMLISQVRALSPERGGQIPAIALSAYAGEYNEQLALTAGFQMHISKPVEPQDLVRAIASLVGR